MAALQKTSWADDVDELESAKTGTPQDFVDENGIRTTIEYVTNEDGKKVKITRRTRKVLQPTLVQHAVASRLQLPKFGQEKGNKPGPDRATTTVGEEVVLKIRAPGKGSAPVEEPTAAQNMKAQLSKAGAGKVTCRLCKGDHFTAKCPYKDTLAGLDTSADAALGIDSDMPPSDSLPPSNSQASVGRAGGPSKYVPPSMREGASAGERMGSGARSGSDLPTLRVTNVSEDTEEQDLRDLFSNFGRVARVYVGKDRETGAGKGFAFVSFEDRAVAQRAMEKVNGKGYDNLILSVQWSQPRTDGPPR